VKKKTIWITSAAVAAALVAGGAGLAIADPFDNDGPLTGTALDKASSAALDAVGSGTVTDTEASDEGSAQAYEVEVTLADGTDVDVALDRSFALLWVDGLPQAGATSSPTAGTGDDSDGGRDDNADDTSTGAPLAPLSEADRSAAAAAALAALPPGTTGTVTEVEPSDDFDHAYEVEITRDNGEDIDIELDENFTVTKVEGVPAA
jgi:uncharacterized membrane protein YkoI